MLSKCEICQGLLDEEDLFCANCGTEVPHRETVTADAAQRVTHNFECAGCGASMSFDASAGHLRCPFCGSQRLEAQRDAVALAPQRVVPFDVTRDAAVAAMRAWLGRGFWRPGNLSADALVVSTTSVYVPYWVFEARTHTYWTADSSQTPAGARADWYPMSGDHHGQHSNLLIGASGALSPAETAAICPFDLAGGVVPDEIDLEHATVEQFSVPRKYARPRARQGLEALEAGTVAERYIPGRARNVHVNVLVQGLASHPVLLPVWIMAYRYNERVFRFLVNGQTGRATGTAPTSYKKIAALATGVAILVGLLLLCGLGVMAGR